MRITGGLGNQLFKFFHGVALSGIYDDRLVIDRTWYVDSRDRRNLVSNRAFDLDFYHKIKTVQTTEWNSVSSHRIFGQILRRLPSTIQTLAGYMVEGNRDTFIQNSKTPRFVDGSFENFNFLPKPEVILDYLSISRKSTWFNDKMLEVVSDKPIAVHVRRGDFLNIPQMYDVVSPAYYKNTIISAINEFGSRPLHLFSDDPETAIRFLGKEIEIDKIISPTEDVQTPEVLELLSRYPVIIGANSTFSWWAAYIGFLRGDNFYYTMPDKFLGGDFIDPSLNLRHSGATVFPA